MILLLGIYPEETKIEKDTCTPMISAALFTKARAWKQNRCPLTNEWRSCDIYTHTHTHTYIYIMEYYSTIKRDTFESVLMW